jgi:hypothetical protein
MAKRPDLDALIVPKGTEATQSTTHPADSVAKGYAHTLSLRLTADQYRRLRRYVADQEEKTGKRATHQAIIETALDDYLTKAGG